jgi:hypothetical protein
MHVTKLTTGNLGMSDETARFDKPALYIPTDA